MITNIPQCSCGILNAQGYCPIHQVQYNNSINLGICYSKKEIPASKGWECPKCEAVMAPLKDCCVNCVGKK